MRARPLFWILPGLLVLAAWFFWPAGLRPALVKKNSAAQKIVAAPTVVRTRSASTAPVLFAATKIATNSVARRTEFAWRLTNTPKTIGQLMNDPHAILLENALIDIGRPLNFSIPKNLQSPGDPGAYIAQARGLADNAFRAELAAAGGQIVSYIPNNAYLVRISAGGAAGLGSQSSVQSVLPYEPYYKISPALIGAAVQQQSLPDNAELTLGLFADDGTATIGQIEKLGGTVVGTDRSPFGPIVRVIPPADWTALATLPGVQIVELAHQRAAANDLSRVTLGISTDTVTSTNYMNLTGKNVVVEVNDTGIDATHPDFSLIGSAESPGVNPPTRVFGSPLSLVDTNGHGTHVAGIIAGNGSKSYRLDSNEPQGSVTNADFRGKAPVASLYSFLALDDTGTLNIPDYDLQVVPATNNALISNNSWNYDDSTYNLAAASYDAAVRDALPLVTGSQPVLFVFSAGNDGGGDDNGGGGDPDTILSPGTAKDVITVGALEQLRYITNIVTDASGNSNAVWEAATDSGNEVAGYSARGNVGIGTEGAYGRFKPDVVAPGSFVVSTRSSEWDTTAYYNPTNYTYNEYDKQLVEPNTLNYYSLTVPANAAGVNIYIVANSSSPSPFPTNMPIYVSQNGYPTMTFYDFQTFKNQLSIPADTGIAFLQAIQNGGFNFAVGNTNNFSVNYNLITEIITTNDDGNYFEVLSNLNDTLAPYYRYESGTSMAAPAISGVLALMQDYFTNNLHATPSPALMKAMLINGSRSQGSYEFSVTNTINLQGWGLPYVPDILPYGLTNAMSASCSSFFLDQSPTNALATGQSQTFMVTLSDITAQVQPLRVTLAWTDPPGNPAAAIKLVNNLDLVVTNLDTGDIYFGNDFDNGTPSSSQAWNTNTLPDVDSINNVENVFLTPFLGSHYSVTVIGRSVNVNAVTAQTNNVVQDFALVISSGDGAVTNAIAVTPLAANPLAGPQVTFVTTTNTLLMNQFAGANSPLIGTNTVGAGAGYLTNAVITLGETNQWHFYVVTNGFSYTNAAFITFLSQTLATPRMGVFADTDQNPTQPEADIDLYVATGAGASGLTNLDPVVISNCVNGVAGDGASLGNGTGTEYVAYSNSVAGQVYYIGVKSETQEAAEYDFLPVFSQQPFSQMNPNGSETVNGLLVPVNIPDGSPAHPGVAYIFALAVQPIQIQDVIVSNQIVHQNFGDLVGLLTHSGASVVLNNHDSLYNDLGIYNFIYDDSPSPILGSQPPDGPGSLNNFQGQQGTGPWILTEVDNSLTQTGSVTAFNLLITPHQDLSKGINISVQGGSFYYGYIDVPVGATNLTISATNTTLPPDTSTPTSAGELFEKFGAQPTLTEYDKLAVLTNFPTATPTLYPGATISVGPTDLPPIQPGRYYVTIYNPSILPQTYYVIATVALGQAAPVDYGASGPTNLLDDAVMYSTIFVTNTDPIAALSVGLRVDHPRISDLVFHLISPDGTRYLLMENRGGTSTNGAGVTIISTNDFPPQTSSGGPQPQTNIVNVSQTFGTVAIDYDFFDLPDEMTIYYQGAQIFDSGLISGSGTFNVNYGPGTSTNLTIIMNEMTNSMPTTAWTYTIHSIQTNFYYLVLTDDTNLTTTPIKFAPPPFVPVGYFSTNFSVSDFESVAPGEYVAPAAMNGWSVISNQVSVVNDAATADQGNNFLALANGAISNNLATVPGVNYTLSYAYRGPGIMGWWRGENNANSSVNGNNPTNVQGITYTNGEVGQAFIYNGSTSLITMPPSTSLAVSNLTIEGWVYSTDSSHIGPIIDYGGAGQNAPIQLWINTTGYNAVTPNGLHGVIRTSTGALEVDAASPGIVANQWCHVAFTVNAATRTGILYCNGIEVASANTPGPIDPLSLENVNIGYRDQGSSEIGAGDRFLGNLDEISIYNRPLSGSEIKAINNRGPLGKYDPTVFNSSPADSLAETSVAIPGIATNTILGNNTNWLTANVSFTATQSSTPVVIAGLEPGMLMDAFGALGSGGGSNLYYLPEQDLSPLIGTSAYGTWQLEIQDDRVGATNQTVLDSWQLQLTFANTNPVPATMGQTNFVPAGGLAWYEVDVPTNADFATNILTFATAPLNMWFSTNMPPTITNVAGGDVQFLYDQTNGSVTLGTNGSPNNVNPPAYIIPGGIYYIGIQNTNSFTVQYGFEFHFHLILPPAVPGAFAFTEPATVIAGTSAQLNGMATPNGSPSAAWFEWGQSAAYGISTPPVNVGSSSNVVFVTDVITGLMVNLPYHYRLVVSNAFGVTYGFDHVFNQGIVLAWGADFQGQTTPVPPGLTNLVVGVGAGNDFSLALNNDGTVVAWGDDSQGQTNVPVALSNAVAVAGGYSHSLALRSDRTVTVWGDDTYGQTNVPPNLTNAVEAASGNYHCLALSADGFVTAWGRDNQGQTNVVAGLSNVVAVAGGDLDSLALKNDGTVVAWGSNADGETNVPPDLTNVVAIAAGYKHNLALKSDGTVTAWGFNGNGQTNVPASLTNVIAIAAGGYHCLALLNDGTIRFWGDSSSGQTNFYPANLTNAFTIAAGGFHNLAVNGKFALNVTNTPPYWTNGLDGTTITMSVLTTKVINNSALDSNAPPQLVFYSFVNPPPFASIDAFTGIITLSPQLTDGPSTNIITTVATDNGFPPLSATNRFTLIVTSTNTPPPVTNAIPIFGITQTNIGGSNGFRLTWFAPSNDLFQVQWTTNLAPANWITFTNIVGYNTNYPASATNAEFTFFDDGSQTGGFGPTRFYRLILLGSGPSTNTPPSFVTTPTNQIINPLNPLVVTNIATDAQSPPQILTYTLTSTVTGTNLPAISTNGIITWTPDVSQAGTSNLFTTIVTDNGSPNLSATNSFSVIVNPVPGISSITYSNGNYLLTWLAPTNDIFEVQVATNLASPVWQTIGANITYIGPVTPTNGWFGYLDNGSQVPFGPLRFYRLQLVGVLPPAAPTVSISSIVSTNGGFLLTWLAPTNDQFNVRWATNIVPTITWTLFPGMVTSTNGTFTFLDTNAPMLMKFYDLILLP